jgi:pimeloyl-ACP methyl ester carboxylesterase
MPLLDRSRAATSRGISFEVNGRGAPVVLLAPAATRAAIWHTFQVPALTGLGYRVITVETRGCPPSIVTPGPYRMRDLVSDVAEVITAVGSEPVRLVGASLGAMVAQELCLAHPELVRSAALIGTRARTDHLRRVAAQAGARRIRAGGPTTADDARYDAVGLVTSLFSPRTFDDDAAVADWLTLFETFPLRGEGLAAQYDLAADYGRDDDRISALRAVRTLCLVIGFEHDRVTPPAACRAVADAIPGARYTQIADCGHFGFLERPELVNIALAGFLRA